MKTAQPQYGTGKRLLTLENIHLTLGENTILAGVNGVVDDLFQIDSKQTRGQVLGLLGPSGIGKTQLFRIIAGLQKPNKGTVKIGEGQKAPNPQEVGVVAQQYPLLMHRTVLGNLRAALDGRNTSSSQKDEKCMDILERFGMKDRASYYPAQLSGGQKQRIAIAQQLLCSKDLILMDEPFSGLDPLMLEEVCELVLEVANMDTNNTIVVVTHDISAAVSVSDHLWLLGRNKGNDGKKTPGSSVRYTHNLLDLGLAWNPHIRGTAQFWEFVQAVEYQFHDLK